MPRSIAIREGASVGNECTVIDGIEIGCEADEICRLGFCTGAPGSDAGHDADTSGCSHGTATNGSPLFGGVTEASADGPDAVVLRWIAAADETLPEAMAYVVFVGTVAGGEDFTTPAVRVIGETTVRIAGLTSGTTYYFVVRAEDEMSQRDCNTNEKFATPAPLGSCISYAQDIKPILDARCIACHSSPTPPRDLYLDTFAGVLAGGLTGNEVVTCQPSSSLLYLKTSLDNPPVGQRMPLGGPYLTTTQIDTIEAWIAGGAPETCPASTSACSDTQAPTFAGATSATLTDATTASVCWSAGTDDTTAAGDLVYDIFEANTPGAEMYGNPPRLTTTAGATCATLSGLTPSQQYCWVVRARDASGNRDANTVEHCVTTTAASCIDYATVIQPIFNNECIQCHAGPGAPRGLHLDSYAGVIAGGQTGNEVVACRATSSLLHQKISMATPPIGVRMPADGPPFLSDSQISAIAQWIDEGGRSSCAAPDPCSDASPPTFAGVASATAMGPTTARLCWSAASDNLTPAASLLYDAFRADVPGGQAFASNPYQTSRPGETCIDVNALSPASTQCWVVRARDGAGNRDTNTVERCVTMPAVPAGCVDYATMIQPLLDRNCTRCHSGARPPQWLRLDSYDHVLEGSVRRNEVTACNPAASLLVNKISATPSVGKRMPFDGPPYLSATQEAMVAQWIANGAQRSCSEAPSCGDTTAPAFTGVSSAIATAATTVRVCWPAATDAMTSAASMRYDVFEASAPGGEVFGQPPQHSIVGATCTDVRVGPGSRTCFVVRARDLAGNRSTNTAEVCATTQASACGVDYEALVQPILSARCTHCHQGPSSPRFLDLRTYGGVLAGGAIRREVTACNWANSLLDSKTSGAACGNRMPFDGPPWLAPSERSLLEGWVTSGARHDCTESSSCGDTSAPGFAGATTATATSPTTIEVCWNAATDAVAPAGSIVYEIYDATTPGGQNFARPAPYAVAGQTCTTVSVPTGQQTCFVVRARDLGGNRDANTVSRCATPGGACFVYNDLVQPVFDSRCVHCHSGAAPPQGIRWDTYAHAVGNTGEVEPCDAGGSKLNRVVEDCEMPFDTTSGSCRACLTNSQTRILRQWVDGGAEVDCPWGSCP
ncbi:MAG: hypothetical protein ACKV2T_34115 [Kofleriaceae bacterium]